MKVLIIGVSGVTCGGKSTMILELKKLFPKGKVFSQDDYFLDVDDPRHVRCKDVDHINYDILTSLDMEKMHKDIVTAIGINSVCVKKSENAVAFKNNLHCNLSSVSEKLVENDVQLIFLDGFLLFNYKPLLPLMSLKYYFTLSREECLERRNGRVYDPPDTPGYFEKCVWPEYLKHFEEVKMSVSNVTYFGGESRNILDIVLRDIYDLL